MRRFIEIEELKDICLDILSAVHTFCEENHIMYSLSCGSLIGAIRHQGYIPWDDDIDIYMLREDYNRFLSLFPEIYKKNYSVISLERSTQWNCPFAKVYDIRTVMEEDKRTEIKGLGIGIDIFPIDNATDDEQCWIKYEKRRRQLIGLYIMKDLQWRKSRSFLKNIFVVLCSFPLLPFSARFFAKIIDNYSQKFNQENSLFYAENCYGHPYNERIPKSDFSHTIDWPFEKHTFKIMNGYDDYLTLFYGDYMQLPPIEERTSHHHFVAYWKSDEVA